MRPTNRKPTALWLRIEQWAQQQVFEPNQTQMAKYFEVSTSALSNWKYGDDVPTLPNLLMLADKTGIDLAELIGLTEHAQQLAARGPESPHDAHCVDRGRGAPAVRW